MARYDLNYKPWQRKMVDPNHPGGAVKYGVYPASPAGENMLMGGLAGSLLPLLPLRSIPSVYKHLGRVLPRARITPHMGTRPNAAVRPRHAVLRDVVNQQMRARVGGLRGGRFRGQRYGSNTTIDDMAARFGQQPRVDTSLRGVRPYRGPRGIGLYKGTRTGSVNPPPRGGGNPLRRWWQNNNPWM